MRTERPPPLNASQAASCEFVEAAIARHLDDLQEREARIAEAETETSAPADAPAAAGPLQMTNAQVELATEIGVFMQETSASRGSKVGV